MGAKGWVVVYLNEEHKLAIGPSYGPDEEEDALEEVAHYRRDEGAFLIEIDLTKVAKEAGFVAKKTQKRGVRCLACKEIRPKEAFEGSPFDGICVECFAEDRGF